MAVKNVLFPVTHRFVMAEMPDEFIKVVISPKSATVARKGTQQLTASVASFPPTLPTTVVWSLTGKSHSNTTISNAGLLTVHNAESVGVDKIRVRATSTYDPAIYDEAVVSII